jgi:hypothetical protein
MHHWVIAGIVAASARFIPLPFVDALVCDRCRKYVVAKTLDHHQMQTTVADLKPYYGVGNGCVAGCAGGILLAPLWLLLFPIRKLISLITSVRGVPMEITRTVLLGRALDRRLREGEIDAEEAAKMRRAFDLAFARMDLRGVRAAISDAISQANHWKSGAVEIGRWVARLPRGAEPDTIDADFQSKSDVDQAASQVEEVLRLPETAKLFTEFDQRFDEAMKSLP